MHGININLMCMYDGVTPSLRYKESRFVVVWLFVCVSCVLGLPSLWVNSKYFHIHTFTLQLTDIHSIQQFVVCIPSWLAIVISFNLPNASTALTNVFCCLPNRFLLSFQHWECNQMFIASHFRLCIFMIDENLACSLKIINPHICHIKINLLKMFIHRICLIRVELQSNVSCFGSYWACFALLGMISVRIHFVFDISIHSEAIQSR